MSKLNDLIKKYCPNGVEYVRLGNVCNLIIGFAFKSNLFRDIGNPVCRTKDIKDNKIDFSSMKCFDLNDYSKNLKKYIIEPNDIVIGMSGTIKVGINTTNKHCYLNQRVGKFVCDKTKIVDKFLYYFLCNSVLMITEKISGGSVKNLGNNDLLELKIPLPPLPVQEEIVKILDKFTDLENDLENELRMRKMQFNAYRDKLLTFDKNGGVRFEKLETIATIVRGASPRPIKNFVTKNKYGVNWIKIGDVSTTAKYVTSCAEKITVEGSKKSRKVKPGDFILSNSMSFGRPYILKIKGCIHDGWLSISNFEEYVIPDYLYYVLTSNYLQFVMRKKACFDGAVQNLNADIVKSLTIPVPPLEKQREIVEKLDKFNDMCNEISDGLPLEIELRKKQYEFYRDKLLSFDKKAS